MAVASRAKQFPDENFIQAIVDAKRYLWRDSFAPDPTTNAKALLENLLRSLNNRLTPDERARLAYCLDPKHTPLTVSLP